jgi:hypothetical protein
VVPGANRPWSIPPVDVSQPLVVSSTSTFYPPVPNWTLIAASTILVVRMTVL